MIDVKVELRIYDGLSWLAMYTYIIDGRKLTDLNNFNTIVDKPGKLDYTKGWSRAYPPLLLVVT